MDIKANRLWIRDFQLSDIQDAFLYLSDPLVMQYIEQPFTLEQTQGFVLNYGMQKHDIYAVECRLTNTCIGHVIYHPFADESSYEIGVILSRSYWGQGYASEIMQSLIDHAKSTGITTVIVETTPQNQPIIRIAEKYHMTLLDSNPLLVYELKL